MDSVLQLFLVNSVSERESFVFNQEHSFMFLICHISLPEFQKMFVYFLISCRDPIFYYIGMTNCIYRRTNKHNSGSGYQSTTPPQIRPFSVFTSMCGLITTENFFFI